jgi:stalled ribosome rescue protein Dom34
MKTVKKLGIWMDHSSAHLTEFPSSPIETTIIRSNFTHEDKENSLVRGEDFMHTKEQHRHSEYYNKLGDVINNYDEVILFGPTEAKSELLNILRSNPLFAKIKIDMKQTDKMTESQQQTFVKDYFTKSG